METLNFNELSDCILSLFEVRTEEKKSNSQYSYRNLIRRACGWRDGCRADRDLIKLVGDKKEFYNWLKLKVKEFFVDFQIYFQSEDKRMNRRRYYEYKAIILNNKSKQNCKTYSFRENLAVTLFRDVCSLVRKKDLSGFEIDMVEDNEENRRLVVLNCIQNHLNRLFLVPVFCWP